MEVKRIRDTKKAFVTVEDGAQDSILHKLLPKISVYGLSRIAKALKNDIVYAFTGREARPTYPYQEKVSRRELGRMAVSGLISKIQYEQVVLGSVVSDPEHTHVKIVGVVDRSAPSQPYDYEAAGPEISEDL